MASCTKIATLIFLASKLVLITNGKPLDHIKNDFSQDIAPKCRGSDKYPYHVYLDSLGHFNLNWDINYKKEEIYFYLCIQVTTTAPSLFAIGFSEHGSLFGADLITIFWNGDDLGAGTVIWVQDAYTDANGTLIKDRRQDVELIEQPRFDMTEGQLQVMFRRAFDTCEAGDYAIDTGTTHIVYLSSPHLLDVYSLATPYGLDITNNGMPTARSGFQQLQLLKPQVEMPKMADDAKTLRVTVDKVKVPSDETTYWCSVSRLPQHLASRKHHITSFAGYLTKGNEDILHHIELFHCDVPRGVEVPLYDGSCWSPDKPAILDNCARVIAAWAIGAPPFDFPAEAGKVIGADKDDTYFSPYVMLEVHYNNGERRSGAIDSSGIEMVYTDQLRPYDAGTLEVGLIYNQRMAVPPMMTLFRLEGFCLAECTQKAFPPDGIHIFASQLHTHLTGRRAYTKHIRNGIELPEVVRDNHYSPMYQEIRIIPENIIALPGDEFIMVCEDATPNKTKPTLGGFTTADEMCVNYMHYYPKIDLEVCKSTIDPGPLDEFFRATGVPRQLTTGTKSETANDAGKSYNSINWTTERGYELQRLYDNSPIVQDCLRSNGEPHPGYWDNKVQPTIRYPLPVRDRKCRYYY